MDRKTGRGPPERNRQTGTMAELGALEAMAVQGALEAMADGLRGPWPRSPSTPPPKKISLGKSGGIRSPPGLDTQNST